MFFLQNDEGLLFTEAKFRDLGMDQYLLIPCLGGWTSILTQLFWCSQKGYYCFWHSAISWFALENLDWPSEKEHGWSHRIFLGSSQLRAKNIENTASWWSHWLPNEWQSKYYTWKVYRTLQQINPGWKTILGRLWFQWFPYLVVNRTYRTYRVPKEFPKEFLIR